MTLEIILIAVSIAMTVGLGVYVVKRPSVVVNASYAQLQAQMQAQLNTLRDELEQERAQNQAQVSALRLELAQERQVSRDTRIQLQEVLDRNRRLFAELDRQIAINALRDKQLRQHDLEPDDLPEHLRDSRLDTPGIAIRLTTQGGNVAVRGDIVGGDLRENAQKKEEE